jgi:hypothetical protein
MLKNPNKLKTFSLVKKEFTNNNTEIKYKTVVLKF